METCARQAGDACRRNTSVPDIDWWLAAADCANGASFLIGLVLLLLGATAAGASLWLACGWLDWWTLRAVRAKADDDTAATRIRLERYVQFRVASAGAAHAVAVIAAVYLMLLGQGGTAALVLFLVGGGTLLRDALRRASIHSAAFGSPQAGLGPAQAGSTVRNEPPLPGVTGARGEEEMKATTILKLEHREIERVLAALEEACDRLEAGRPPGPLFFEQAMDFIRTFADRCHHHKEEDLLFTTMVERGFAREGGPIAVMLAEHEQGRAEVRRLSAAVARMGAGEEGTEAELVASARAYVALLSDHIRKEDLVLYPLADSVLTPADDEELVRRFDEVDAELGHKAHERYTHLATSLAQQARVL
jgi:hemerythrin-like domain-containing protein